MFTYHLKKGPETERLKCVSDLTKGAYTDFLLFSYTPPTHHDKFIIRCGFPNRMEDTLPSARELSRGNNRHYLPSFTAMSDSNYPTFKRGMVDRTPSYRFYPTPIIFINRGNPTARGHYPLVVWFPICFFASETAILPVREYFDALFSKGSIAELEPVQWRGETYWLPEFHIPDRRTFLEHQYTTGMSNPENTHPSLYHMYPPTWKELNHFSASGLEEWYTSYLDNADEGEFSKIMFIP